MTRNTVPRKRVPTFLVELSESPELSAGKVRSSLITDAEAPAGSPTMFFETCRSSRLRVLAVVPGHHSPHLDGHDSSSLG